MADPIPGGVPFQEAIDFFRQKLRLPTRAWTDIWQGQHARAFVVAGAQSDALLADFQQSIAKALEQGTTLADFRKDFDTIVAKHGWSYNGSRGWRSAVIFNTNLRTAYAAGRWTQIQRLKAARPYLRYSAVMDNRTRPLHRLWHGTVLPVDHPWWQTHYPPNGWNCRCSTIQLNERDLKRYGYKVTDAPPIVMQRRTLNTPNGPVSIDVPEGIDAGFGYNVGESAWGRGEQAVLLDKHGTMAPLEAPGAPIYQLDDLPAETPRAELGPRAIPGDEAALRHALASAIGPGAPLGGAPTLRDAQEGGPDWAATGRIFTDPLGGRVNVTQALVDHMLEDAARQDGREAFFPFIPELIEDPAEIWAGFAIDTETRQVFLRSRYVKLLDLGRERTVALVADADRGAWSAFTVFRGDRRYLATLRSGLRVYERGAAL